MKLRFFTGIGFSILFFLAIIWLAGNFIGLYIDPASFIAAILLPHILISFMNPPSKQRKLIHEVLSDQPAGDRETIKEALLFLKSLTRMIIGCTVATIILGVIGIMAYLEDTAHLGANFAVALIVTFYASLYIMAVIEPLRLAAEKKLA